ncbi:MAG: phosphopantothenoylcysteine decarboxylase [Candidatus Omnitrophica bacterium]|nr:phosphopantothenoylcysteine decarboxylase [Candidatus Omnitrophota bacterium]MBU1128699.1 phosphopantothenoylcysteine decarboxylase [Candidatus Omnitrophota bacterium]MBU1784814.1 phosphopantothenoylcysteine decarboxylase [Candidatus Omnitrophota bacterium]MBU1850976.1 phosphopantothenoylcysteine decarboxylase [Candidatus Omnitrophota bacterium]
MKKKIQKPTSILVTAGPTVEAIDPVRFISNRSTGEMGYAVARAASKRGFRVVLISGPVCLAPLAGVETLKVETTAEMMGKVNEKIQGMDCIVMTAAVCDFRPGQIKKEKIKKSGKLTLELIKTPDILKGIGKREGLVKVGFALETERRSDPIKKLKEKAMDLLVMNIKDAKNDPFGKGAKNFILLGKNNFFRTIKKTSKENCAGIILDEIKRLLDEKKRSK